MNNIWKQFNQAKKLISPKELSKKDTKQKKFMNSEALGQQQVYINNGGTGRVNKNDNNDDNRSNSGNNYKDNIENNREQEVFDDIKKIVMKYQQPRDDPFYRPNVIEKLKNVSVLVKKIYYEIYPNKVDEFPKELIKGITYDYERVRTARYRDMKKTEKSDDKYGLKGLRSSAIVAVLFYCSLITSQNPIPVPVFLNYVNDAIRRKGFRVKKKIPRDTGYVWKGKKKGIPKVTHWKAPKEPGVNEKVDKGPKKDIDFSTVTMKMFEDYRTNDKKGIKKYITRITGLCYKNKVKASQFVHVIGRSRMGLSEDAIADTKKLCDEIEAKKILDPKTIPSGTIALASILFTMMKYELPVTKDMFGVPNIPEVTLVRFYNKIVDSNLRDHDLKGRDPFKVVNVKKQKIEKMKNGKFEKMKNGKAENRKMKNGKAEKMENGKPRSARKDAKPRARVPTEDYKVLVE